MQDSTLKTRFINRLPYKTITAVVITGVVCSAGSATASSLITSAQIKDGTIANRDIRSGTISEERLDGALRAKINRLPQNGRDGSNGSNGSHGAKGDRGDRGENGRDGKDGRDGTNLPPDFHVSNKSVGVTASGVVFGPYADGGAQGCSALYSGKVGTKLKDVRHLAYKASWDNSEKNDVGVPYLRLFLENGKHVIFSPNTQPEKATEPDVLNEWNVRRRDRPLQRRRGLRRGHDLGSSSSPSTATRRSRASGSPSATSPGRGWTAGTLRSLEVNDKSWTFGA